MLNFIWLGLILASVILGGLTGRLPQVTNGALGAARDGVMTIALPLWGAMALWLGMMRLAQQSGFAQTLARALRPVITRLFPDVPPDHPAMGSIVLSIAANMLGLGNAATPLGLRAMSDLETLNPRPGVASNAMCTFLAICTSSVQLIPTTAISLYVAAGSKAPTAIVSTAFLATACAAFAGVFSARMLEKLPMFRLPAPVAGGPGGGAAAQASAPVELERIAAPPITVKGRFMLGAFLAMFLLFFGMEAIMTLPGVSSWAPQQGPDSVLTARGVVIHALNAVSLLAVPFLLSFFPLYAALRGVKVYDQFVEGAKEAFPVILRIIPFLVAMLVGIAMFREAGGITFLSRLLSPLLNVVRFPADLLPLVLMRPLSGGATMGIFAELVKRFGPDSFNSRLAGTIYGSTETTFYVLAVYFGSVGIRRTRHAVLAGLIADLTGVVASTVICHAVFG